MNGKLKSIHPIGWNIIIGTLFARLASSMSMPFLAIYLTMTKGVSPGMTGIIIAVSALVGVFTSYIGGNLSDQFGRKWIMMGSIIVWTFVFLGFAFADHVAWFFILNALNGICKSFFEPTSRALLSDMTKPENKLMIFNLRYAAINVGVAIGPLIGLQLGSSKSSLPFIITAFVYMIYTISLLIQFKKYNLEEKVAIKKERVTMKQSLQVLGKDTIFLLALIGIILGNAGYSQFSSTLSQYFANAPVFLDGVKLFSYVLVLNAITVLIVQYPVTRIGKKYSPLVSIMFGTMTLSLSLLGFGMLKSVPLMFACAVLFTVGEVLMFSMTDVFIDQIAVQNLKGTYFGAMGFSGLGGVIGPWLGGFLLDYYGYGNGAIVFAYLAALCSLGFPILLYVKIMINKRDILFENKKLHI
ncbi:MDR family MFS transporter [Ureibacillus endophyticus]|uniref:MFS transporter n=1 Tax=Ureibacillus endophyticus TaxID=1978490 RepID=A0A494Z0F6_9BACL|nr:MFS transporter [Lysinibacillus endophyticus]RKQ15978.1 MFS transporter [Lysinibacillus endophyticus]